MKKINLIKIASLGLVLSSLYSVVLAHNELKTMSPETMILIQKKLIDEGYLKVNANFKLGTYDENTEKAYDKFQDDRQNRELDDMKKRRDEKVNSSTTVSQESRIGDLSFYDRVIVLIKSIFEKLF